MSATPPEQNHALFTGLLSKSGLQAKVLATSREHLHVAGEASYPVPSLATPQPQTTITLAALTQYEAVQLFVDRAVAAQPSFQVTHQNAAAISDICHRLDGIPLAIELAAARVRALSAGEIAARLSDRFRLLAGGDRTALPRQQTLRASIDWSYDLLMEPERALLRRLAVFAGGWTLEAAEAVCAGGEMEKSDVIDLLTHLVEKSLVALDAGGERYRLLEIVRQYARERLDASGEGDEARTRHLAFYLALAEEAMPEARGPKQGAWLARLDLERENLLSAHAWCGRPQGEAQLGLRLVFAVAGYWLPRGLLELGHRVTLEALTRAGAQERNFARCGGLSAVGFLAFFMGRYGEAQGYLEESLAIAREIGHEERIANALRMLGLVSHAQGERTTARRHLEASLALARRLEHKGQLYAVLTALAQLHRVEGDLDAAERLYEESLTLARASGDRVYSVDCLSNLAVLSISRGLGGPARGMLLAALAIAEEIGWKNESQAVLENSAGLAACLGEWKCAARFYGAAEAQREQTRVHRDPADEAFLTPLIARAREALDGAAFAAAEAAGRALSYEDAMAESRAWLETAR
jgi:predicted ATPase